MPEPRPDGIETFIDNLPAALAPLITLDNWCCWKWAQKNAKWTKVPYQPSGLLARSNDATTWASYSTAIDAASDASRGYDGIGWFFDENVSIAAFDVDDCRDPETQRLHPWAERLVERCGTYAETTISGTGIRIIGYGSGAKIHTKKKVEGGLTCEIYRRLLGRYIVITGAQIGTGVLVNIDAVIDEVAAELAQTNEGNGQTSSNGLAGDLVDILEQTIHDGFNEAHGASRSESVWWVILEMLRRAYSKAAIIKTITNPNLGISEHVFQQNNPDRYAERQVSRALETITFAEDRHGKRFPTAANMGIALSKMGTVFRYDDFSGRLMIEERGQKIRDLRDDDIAILKIALERRYVLRVPREMIFDVITTSSRLNAFHPIKDYFDALKWDGVKRLDRWLINYCGSADTEYHSAVGKILLVAAVRRVREPGCKFDEMMVLEAPQGTEKSSALSILAVKDDWFSDTLPLNIKGRETIELSQGKWIIEAAELSGMRRADAEHLKAFLSRQVDVGRAAYGRVVLNVARQYIIIGTTNSDDYLRDFTGNRRFWPVKIGRIDLDKLRNDRDQLWAEACAAEAEGYSIRLPRELWPNAEREQDQRMTIDPYFDALHATIGSYSGRIAAVDVWKAINVVQAASQRTPEQNMRVGAAMKALGWKRDKIAYNGVICNGYVKGPTPRKLVLVERVGNDVATKYEDEPVAAL